MDLTEPPAVSMSGLGHFLTYFSTGLCSVAGISVQVWVCMHACALVAHGWVGWMGNLHQSDHKSPWIIQGTLQTISWTSCWAHRSGRGECLAGDHIRCESLWTTKTGRAVEKLQINKFSHSVFVSFCLHSNGSVSNFYKNNLLAYLLCQFILTVVHRDR